MLDINNFPSFRASVWVFGKLEMLIAVSSRELVSSLSLLMGTLFPTGYSSMPFSRQIH